MERLRGLLLLICGMLLITATASAAPGVIRHAVEPVPGEYIVVLNADMPGASVASMATEIALQHGGRVRGVFKNGIKGFGLEANTTAAQAVAHDPRVAWVEENAYGHLSYDVEYYSDAGASGGPARWHLDRIDQRSSIFANPTHAYAWTSTGAGVAVYMPDTGVQIGHTEFSNGNVTAGANYAVGDGFTPTNPCGGFGNFYNGGHGTATASLVGGRTVGVARGATIVPVKVGSCNPTANATYELTITSLSIIQSLDWILGDMSANPGRRAVVSFSVFVRSTDTGCGVDCISAMDNNVRNLLNAGAVVVASANNQHANHCGDQSPARFGYGGMYDGADVERDHPDWPFVITAGGTNVSDGQYFCQYCLDHQAGDIGSNFGPCVDIYAPAQIIHAAHVANSGAYRDEQPWLTDAIQSGRYANYLTVEWVSSGTSFAAPITAGVVARMLQTFPTMTVRQVWNNLKSSATALPNNFDGDNNPANDILIYISPYN